jgi:hypothetical protein
MYKKKIARRIAVKKHAIRKFAKKFAVKKIAAFGRTLHISISLS